LLSLRELQLRFVAALYEGGEAVIRQSLVEGEPSASARLGVYRNNLREGFVQALALEFPVVQRLVGEEFFHRTALEFQVRHPSHSGDLTHIGEPFAEYLRSQFEGGDLAWLPDVAELEWALECVSGAADAPPIDSSALLRIPPDRYEDLAFEPNAATRLVRSSFPILKIWQTNQPSAPAETVNLDEGGDHLLVRRRNGDLEFVRLSREDFTFARMLTRGASLALATDASLAVNPHFDLAQSLRTLLLAGTFSGVVLNH
jgi:hypothetical protein